MKYTLTLATALLAFTGSAMADDAKKPAPENKPAAEATTAEVTAGDFTFKAGAPWEVRKEPKMMSAGGFTRPGKDGKAGVEADFYHFGPQGGGDTEVNVARWVSQFQPGEDGAKPEA